MATWNLIKAIELTSAESNAGLVSGDIKSAAYPPGHVYRYVDNSNPGGGDVTTQWQTFLSLGGVVDLDALVNDVFRVTAQLIIKGGTKLRMGPGCVILRDWAGTAGNKDTNATFKNENAPAVVGEVIVDPGPWTPTTTDDGIYIEGGRIRPTGDTKIGAGYYLMGTVNLTMVNPVVERSYQDWAFAVGGENFSLTGVRVEENAAVWEDGIHILYGSGVVQADYIHSGDDCFIAGTAWNMPIDGVDFYMGRYYSEKGQAIRCFQNRGGAGGVAEFFATPDQVVRNVRFHDGSGMAGVSRNGLALIEATEAGLLEDISIEGVHFDAGTETHDTVNPYGVYVSDVTRFRMANSTVKNARRYPVHLVDCPQFELNGVNLMDSQGNSSFRALEIDSCIDGKVIGGDIERTLTSCVRIIGTSSVSFQGTTLREIGDNSSGIIADDTTVLTVHGATFRKAAGATASTGIRCNDAAVSIVGDGCIWDVDRPLQQGATPAYARLSKVRRSPTVASGSITTYGDDYLEVLCEGGASDSLAAITSGYKNQVVTIVNGEAAPASVVLTLTAGTGANQLNIGTDYILDTSTAAVELRFNGTNWVPTQALPVVNKQTGTTYTLAAEDAGGEVLLNNASAVTLTVPENSTVPFPIGTVINLGQLGVGQVTVAAAGSVSVVQQDGMKIAFRYGGARLVKHATDNWLMTGDLTA